ncbi:MAG: PEP-CTERM sorting domain-containing protein [Alphaproteobacteria bacterium]|nr:PEP-CTERM sorting domain-containing protein [Alphaproteobacteria bacterium]
MDDVTLSSADVPAPGSFALFGLGFAAVGYMRRRKTAKV